MRRPRPPPACGGRSHCWHDEAAAVRAGQVVITHDGLDAATCEEVQRATGRPVDFVRIDASAGYYDAKNTGFAATDAARAATGWCSPMPTACPTRTGCASFALRARRPTDSHGLARFDGTALYEHLDPREGFHRDWNTYIYNFGRREVQGFLIASALHWLERFHVDGLRGRRRGFHALPRLQPAQRMPGFPTSMAAARTSRPIGFLRHLNAVVAERCPGAIIVAEESTAWPGVTQRRCRTGWASRSNGTWAGCTTRCATSSSSRSIALTTIDDMTFGLLYAFSETLRPADLARRGRARKRLADRQDAGRSLAALRQPAGLFRLHVGASRQEAVVHGLRDRPGATSGTTIAKSTGHLLGDPAVTPESSGWCATSTVSTWPNRPLHRARQRPVGGSAGLIGDDRANSVFAFSVRSQDSRRRPCPGRLQHDAGAASRLSHRRAASRPLARSRQYRSALLRRQRPRQRRRRQIAVEAAVARTSPIRFNSPCRRSRR